MGFISAFANLGSIGSTTKWAIKMYNQIKSDNKKLDPNQIFAIMVQARIQSIPFGSNKYGLDYNKLKYAKKNAFVMHPGPMNRGVEIDSKLADDITRSLIQEQVAMGVAIRMACLDILIKNRDNVLSY